MGDFSASCSLSGLPIGGGMPVVGWKLQNSSFEKETKNRDNRFPTIPLSLPVHGFYDNSGRITKKNSDKDELDNSMFVAICHLDIWKNLPKFWNKEDGTGSVIETMTKAHEEFIKEKNSCIAMAKHSEFFKDELSDELCMAHSALSHVNHGRNYMKWLADIFIYEPSDKSDWNIFPYKECSGSFEQIILNMIISGPTIPNFKSICNDIQLLVVAYYTSYLRGRSVMPAFDMSYHPVQYPDYKMESKWFKMISDKCEQMRLKEKKGSN